MELTFLYYYLGLILIVYVIFKLIDKKINPFKKISFWLTQFFSLTILTICLIFLVLNAIGRPRHKEGINKEYYPNGQLKSEFYIKDGKLDGINRCWYLNGQIQLYSKYKNGQQIDTSIAYLENGKKMIFEIFENGTQIQSISYYDNGKIQSETYNPINSNKINYRKDYYENGKLKFHTSISNSTFGGEGIYYDSNGNIEYKGNYKDGQKDGIWNKFEPSTGQIIDKDTFYFNKPRQFKETWK